jgi:hypothetical protein
MAAVTAAPSLAQVAEKLEPRFARVEFWLKSDLGDEPASAGWRQRCPNCGNYHVNSGAEAMNNDRPAVMTGIVLDSRRVLISDPQVHPRFVREIAVRHGAARVKAAVAAYMVEQNALVLELSEAISSPALKTDGSLSGPYLQATYARVGDEWTLTVDPFGGAVSRGETRSYMAARPGSLIVTGDGTPVAVVMNDEVPVGDAWKAGVDTWKSLPVTDYEKRLAGLEELSSRTILQVNLHFRSPRGAAGRGFAYRRFDPDGENKTDVTALGVLLNPTTVLLLHEMTPQVTGRLERINVQTPDGGVAGTFAGSLSDYGGALIRLATPQPSPLKVREGDARPLRGQLLMAAEVAVHGDKRVARFCHRRIPGFEVGWREKLYPQLPESERTSIFLFDAEQKLVALPIVRRQKGQDRGYRSHESGKMTLAAQLLPVLTEPDKYVDASNIPLSEEEEMRIGWLGVQLQQMTEELAEANKVSDMTRGGTTGALVSSVYPGSPAAAAGIQPLDVLVNVRVEGQAKPLEIRVQEFNEFGGQFPWERLDQLPEQYLSQVPMPWPDMQNSFNTMLTEIGIGKAYKLELIREGKPIQLDLKVLASPPYFASAPRYKHEALGFTVRDITFEVQQYLQRKMGEPGVVISKIEQGSKAYVGGLRPYEVITHVNDQPVVTAADFSKLAEGQTELKLQVKRMTRGRLVRLAVPTTKPAKAPTPAP